MTDDMTARLRERAIETFTNVAYSQGDGHPDAVAINIIHAALLAAVRMGMEEAAKMVEFEAEHCGDARDKPVYEFVAAMLIRAARVITFPCP